MSAREQVRRLVGETLREIGILAVVFVPLDATFSGQAVNAALVLTIVALSFTLIACGMMETLVWTQETSSPGG